MKKIKKIQINDESSSSKNAIKFVNFKRALRLTNEYKKCDFELK